MNDLLILVGAAVCLYPLILWHTKKYRYICRKCSSKFDIGVLKNFRSPHFFSTKFLKCPECRKISWCKIINKKLDDNGKDSI